MTTFPFTVKAQAPLAPYSYIKIGGPAEYLVSVNSLDQLAQAVKTAVAHKLPYRVLGAASNVLISDAGLPGLTIINRVSQILPVPDQPLALDVASGTLVNHLVHYTTTHALGGLEYFLGVPGTVGGALYNNSHYLDHLFGDQVLFAKLIDSAGHSLTLNHKELALGYDQSVLQTNQAVVLSVRLHLKPGDPKILKTVAHEALLRRKKTQPLDLPSSGCMFKNPHPAVCHRLRLAPCAAGYLIDQAGLKGYTVGGAQVSQTHANFVVNTGSATAHDVIAVSNYVKKVIKNRYHLDLDREIFLLGKHDKVE